MLNGRDQRFAARMRELTEEGRRLAKTERHSEYGPPYIQGEDAAAVHAWLAQVENILGVVFGNHSAQSRHFAQLVPDGPSHIRHEYDIEPIRGLLIGALNDLENGFLIDRELLLVGEIFDSVLEQAKHLQRSGYKDVAAILGRVVLEDALRRIATTESIDSTQKAAKINDELKAKSRYSQPQWRQIQTWLDIGNAAAHGNFGEYTADQVGLLLEGVGAFVASELHS